MHLFPRVWSAKNVNTPNWSSMADNAITLSSIDVGLRSKYVIV